MNKRKERLKYILLDFLASFLAWTLFYLYRRIVIEPRYFGYEVPLFTPDRNYFLAIVAVPLFWFCLFWLFGSYRNIYRKSRVRELGQTFVLTFAGVIVIFFTLLIDDFVKPEAFRLTFLVYLSLQYVLVMTCRLAFLGILKHRLKNRIIGFNTLLLGSGPRALQLYDELENQKYSQGYRFIGYMSLENGSDKTLSERLPYKGNVAQLNEIIDGERIEEVVFAVDSSEHHLIDNVLHKLRNPNVCVKVIPDMYDLITGTVKMNYIFGTALIEVNPEIMPVWQRNLKRVLDVVASILVLLLLSPMYLLIALGVKLSSSGPIFYRQERIGLGGKPFMILKFRTMYTDAEKFGPRLSSDHDPRITKIGRTLRRYRLDEFPQFWNVLKGDMSLVGPRPERAFFIEQIVSVAPHYTHLHKVRPGITSWGQIKYGYAENVSEMVDRMKFDILYIENMSLAMDFKILFYTVVIMIQGRGK